MFDFQSKNAADGDGFNSPLLIVFGVCALLAAGIGAALLPGKHDISARSFEFEPLNIDTKRLQKERASKFKSVRLDSVTDEWAQFLTTAREINRFDFVSPGLPQEAAAVERLGYLSNELIPATGYEGFVAATLPMRDACDEGLGALREALGAGEIDLEQALSDPPVDRFAQYRDNCGNQLSMLLQRGLLSEDGTWTAKDPPIVADILSRYRGAHLLADQYSPWLLLTPYETEILARWRVEQAAGYSSQQRLKYLAEIHQLIPDYHVDFARGVLAYQENDLKKALEIFERLDQNHPGERYGAYVEHLKKKVSAG